MLDISIAIAFSAGLLSFLSPCVLPLVPVYLASLAGPEVFDINHKNNRVAIFLHSLSFVSGFSIIFIILGGGAGLLGFTLISHLILLRKISGSMLIVFGLFMLVALKVPWLNYERRLSPSHGVTTGYLRSFLTGGIFSLAWTPCVGPILGGILALASSSGTAWHGGYLLAIYSLGLGLPFMIIGLAFDSFLPLLKRISIYSTAIYIVSSLLLIAAGVLILTDLDLILGMI